MRTETTIRFALPSSQAVRVELFDAAGRMIRSLADGNMAAGYHSVVWDGKDGAGRAAAAGMYYYRVQAGGEQQTHKLMLVK